MVKYFVFVIGLVVSLATISIAQDSKKSQYRAPTPKEIRQNYANQAMKHMMRALESAKIVGAINESLNCPCYEISVSTKDHSTLLRIDREKCKETK